MVGVDIAGPESATFRVADYRRIFRRARQHGLGITVHTGESGPVEEIARVIELLEPDRIGHGVKAAYDPRTMAMLRERGIVLEICPTSNLNTGVVSGWEEFRWIFDQFHRNGVRYTISTDGPEMLKTYIRDELATLGRLGHPLGRGAASRSPPPRWPHRSCPTCRTSRCLVREPATPRGRGARGGLTPITHAAGAIGQSPVSLPWLPGRLADRRAPAGCCARRTGSAWAAPTRYSQQRSPAAMCRSRTTSDAEDLAEQVQLRAAGRPLPARDVQDRAVVLHEADPVAVHARLGEVAHARPGCRASSAHAVAQRGVRGERRVQARSQRAAGLPSPGGEDVLDQRPRRRSR